MIRGKYELSRPIIFQLIVTSLNLGAGVVYSLFNPIAGFGRVFGNSIHYGVLIDELGCS